ncbi:Putative transposase DNA-binding domain protein [Nonomuraea coxensis DSM 45129]|uniref:Transposase DNA-binding domain protein n=2 Tax=Nonomuraea coxensis TaxID=404386 RepID=A0ABX8TT22_9ACTN|nr:Putative transposase DNA-binding domain protein [Nonomuraea coxensis DSM 45129]
MLAGRKYRLEFDSGQRAFAERLGGICRAVWNTGLEQRREYRREYRRRGQWITYAEQCRQLADAKKDPYCDWLADAPAQVIQQTLKDLDQACRKHGAWTVRWKSKAKWRPSFRFPTARHLPVERINRKWGRVFLPKFGWTRFRMSRRLGGSVKSATGSRDGRHWFISFLIDDGIAEREEHTCPQWAGVDRGVVTAAVTSDGEFFDRRHAGSDGVSSRQPPRKTKQDRKDDLGYLTPGEAERYLRLQRRLARTKKGSKRRKTVTAAMSEIMRRVRWRRADFNAQAAHRLTRMYGHVVIEDLNTKGMSAAVKPKPDPGWPGRFLRNGAAAKSGLNKAILDKGWYGLEVALRSKARYTGSAIHKINPAYTSQTCPEPACGKVDEKSRKSQAIFSCTSCGHTDHADIVGAKNIKSKGQAAGLVVSGRGDPPGSVKRQAPRSTARAAQAARAAA